MQELCKNFTEISLFSQEKYRNWKNRVNRSGPFIFPRAHLNNSYFQMFMFSNSLFCNCMYWRTERVSREGVNGSQFKFLRQKTGLCPTQTPKRSQKAKITKLNPRGPTGDRMDSNTQRRQWNNKGSNTAENEVERQEMHQNEQAT